MLSNSFLDIRMWRLTASYMLWIYLRIKIR
uniref:Uncharacterized protein n=1 Tax=Podoviridae sp. ct8Lf7 TaxID=2827723 RepID=A0A8S5S1A4_9CAUD|nr:MAG TPA: hypothetical protein [Podoviridae sp. ct8Lf7]